MCEPPQRRHHAASFISQRPAASYARALASAEEHAWQRRFDGPANSSGDAAFLRGQLSPPKSESAERRPFYWPRGEEGAPGGVPRDEGKIAKEKSAWRARGGGAHSIVPRNRNSMGNVRSHDLRCWLAGRVPSRRAGACCRPGPAEFPGEGPVPQHGPAVDASRVRTWGGGESPLSAS